MANPASLKPFKPGDKRINRKGRPKSFDALRTLTQQIAHEVARTTTGEPLTSASGHAITVVEAILRQWAHSKNPALQIKFMEICFGKVPDRVEVGGKTDDAIPIIVVAPGMLESLKGEAPNPNAINYRKNLAAIAPLDDE